MPPDPVALLDVVLPAPVLLPLGVRLVFDLPLAIVLLAPKLALHPAVLPTTVALLGGALRGCVLVPLVAAIAALRPVALLRALAVARAL